MLVNPVNFTPPSKWMNDPEISKDVQDLYWFLFQLWQRTGAGTDLVEEALESSGSFITSAATQGLGVFELLSPVRVISNNYVTIGNEILFLSKNVTITLNATPSDGERVYVKASDREHDVSGNGKKIDGHTSISYKTPYIGHWFVYSVELDAWRVI